MIDKEVLTIACSVLSSQKYLASHDAQMLGVARVLLTLSVQQTQQEGEYGAQDRRA